MRIATQINSGKNVKEISETFDIPENVLYRWKTDQNMKTIPKEQEFNNLSNYESIFLTYSSFKKTNVSLLCVVFLPRLSQKY
jgi:hypothetical protein